MKERPILFNTEMVQAILAGRKKMTRRVVSPAIQEAIAFMGSDDDFDGESFARFVRFIPINDDDSTEPEQWGVYCSEYPEEGTIPLGQSPKGEIGDQLWVRETFVQGYDLVDDVPDMYDIDGNKKAMTTWYRATQPEGFSWANDDGDPVNIPWKPSIHMPRWASRIQLEITNVRIERLQDISEQDAKAEGARKNLVGDASLPIWSYREGFKNLWDSIYKNWDANPCVWVIEFKVVS